MHGAVLHIRLGPSETKTYCLAPRWFTRESAFNRLATFALRTGLRDLFRAPYTPKPVQLPPWLKAPRGEAGRVFSENVTVDPIFRPALKGMEEWIGRYLSIPGLTVIISILDLNEANGMCYAYHSTAFF